MFTTIITDCKEANEAGRQISRFNSLGLGPANLVGIDSDFSDDATIEGGTNLIDILDATEGKDGVIVLNVAPRGNKKDGGNGTHFAYFYYNKTLVISTLKGYCLSLIKRLNIVSEVNLVELSVVLDFTVNKKITDKKLADYIVKSQFRSFDFIPRLARWLKDGIKIPYSNLSLSDFNDPPHQIWCIDAFGNAKTTLLSNELDVKHHQKIKTNFGIFMYYERLKDVPYGETALYTGSSGVGNSRFLELATQGIPGSAANKLNLKIGDKIEIK